MYLTVSDQDLCPLLSKAGLSEVRDRPRGGHARGRGTKVSRKELRTGAKLALQVPVTDVHATTEMQEYHIPVYDRTHHSSSAWTMSNSDQ